jgi:hypothetical protein
MSKPKFTKTVRFDVEITIDGLADELAAVLSHEETFALIKLLDQAMCDYDFTLDLARHCVKELIAESSSSEPFQLTDLTP